MTRRFALISDLHANMEAVGAVMADIAAHGISEIHCLGDVVGYGPEPEAVCDVVRASCGIVLAATTTMRSSATLDASTRSRATRSRTPARG